MGVGGPAGGRALPVLASQTICLPSCDHAGDPQRSSPPTVAPNSPRGAEAAGFEAAVPPGSWARISAQVATTAARIPPTPPITAIALMAGLLTWDARVLGLSSTTR